MHIILLIVVRNTYNRTGDSLATVVKDGNDIIQDGGHVILKEQHKRKPRDNIPHSQTPRGWGDDVIKKNSENFFFFQNFLFIQFVKICNKKIFDFCRQNFQIFPDSRFLDISRKSHFFEWKHVRGLRSL